MENLFNKKIGASLLVVMVGSALTWLMLGAPVSGVDEADIFLVYARNFVEGHGFAYNIGGERVEGFTSMLWMLICSFFFVMTQTVEVPLFLLNLAFGLITVYACLRRCERKVTFLILLCSAPAWFAWCQVALMESGLWCMLLTLAILAVSERRVNACVLLLPLLVLTRPESMLWGAWLIMVLFLGFGMEVGWRAGVRMLFRPLFMFGILSAALILFRGHYFGYPFPNPFYAKISQNPLSNLASGTGYLFGYLFSNPAVLIVVLVFGWVVIREIMKKRWLSRPLAVGLCLLPGLGIPIIVGGDHFGAYRFYQPIWPLLCLLASWALPLLYERLNKGYRRAAPLILLLCGWLTFLFATDLKNEFRIAREGREHGTRLERMFSDLEALPSLAVITAGGHKYAYSGMVYDLRGLNSTEMAHAPRSDGGIGNHAAFIRNVFFGWHPDILIPGDSSLFDQRGLKELQSDPLFRERYAQGELWYNDEDFSAYFSMRFLSTLPEGHYTFVSATSEEPVEAVVPLDLLLKYLPGAEDCASYSR
jgi:hypothetical protein